jgi:ABC-type spermidine/putrescine transport system permease subunit II
MNNFPLIIFAQIKNATSVELKNYIRCFFIVVLVLIYLIKYLFEKSDQNN